MTTTELIELLKKHERGGATGRPREVMFEVDDRIIGTDGIEVTGSGDGLISELFLSLPSAQPEIVRCKDCKYLLPKGSFCSKDMCGLRGMAHYRHVDIHNDFCSWGEVEDG